MPKFNGTTFLGRPYVKVTEATDTIPPNVNPGQWLRINGKSARLAAGNRVVYPNGRSPKTATVSKAGFSLACGKNPASVLTKLPVRGVSQVDSILELLRIAM